MRTGTSELSRLADIAFSWFNLEGLTVSYYSRNARAYDALMQMARWFGYRPQYEDLCRVWMTDEAAGWYKYVADSTENLFDQLRSMRQVKRTPKNYVLKIRQSLMP